MIFDYAAPTMQAERALRDVHYAVADKRDLDLALKAANTAFTATHNLIVNLQFMRMRQREQEEFRARQLGARGVPA